MTVLPGYKYKVRIFDTPITPTWWCMLKLEEDEWGYGHVTYGIMDYFFCNAEDADAFVLTFGGEIVR